MSDGTPLPNRTAETPVSGRSYPDEDPSGRRWSEIWRAAVEELNANALVSDLATNRLDYSPEDGTLFVPSNGGDWYLGTGTSWKNLGGIGDIDNHTANTTNPHDVTAAQAGALATTGGTVTGDTTFTNTTHDSVGADILNGVVAVTPDMSAADINAAIMNDLPAEGGMVVFRPGTYTVDVEPIDLSKPYLYFRGHGDVTITIAGTFQSNVIANVAGQNNEFFGLENIEVVGNRAADGSNEDTAASQAGIRAQYTKAVSVEDVRIRETVDSSLNVGGAYTDFLFCRNSRFENAGHLNHASTDAHIVAPGDSTSGTEIHITDCHFDYTTDNAVYLNNCVSAYIAGCRFHDCFINAFDSNMDNVKYVGCDITGAPPRGNAHFYFGVGGSNSITIRDCDWHDLGTMPTGFDNAIQTLSGLTNPIEDVLIDGCTFDLNSEINAFRWQDRGGDIRFTNNHIIDPSGGASRCDDSVNLTMAGNTVRYTSNATSTAGNTLMLVNVSDSRLADNHVIDERASLDSITNAYRIADTANGNAGETIIKDNTAVGTSGASHNVDLTYPYLRFNGLGYNAGDPNTTGQWTGNGIEGLVVRDTTNANTYLFNNGGWSQIAAT